MTQSEWRSRRDKSDRVWVWRDIGDWRVNHRVELDDLDRPVIAETRLRATGDVPEGGLTMRAMRAAARLDDALAVASAHLRGDVAAPNASVARYQDAAARLGLAVLFDGAPGRRLRGNALDVPLAYLSAIYAQACLDGWGAHVSAMLSRTLGVEPTRMRDRIHDARRRGLLTPTQNGRAAGEPTALARSLIADAFRTRNGHLLARVGPQDKLVLSRGVDARGRAILWPGDEDADAVIIPLAMHWPDGALASAPFQAILAIAGVPVAPGGVTTIAVGYGRTKVGESA